jgi:hypothetical protein
MSSAAPARLTSALLVRKGNATPATYGLPTQSISSLVGHRDEDGERFPTFETTEGVHARPRKTLKTPAARRKPRRPDSRARLTLRLNPERYLRLHEFCTDHGLTRQQLLVQAIEAYLDKITPSICGGKCVCLTEGCLSQDEPARGCQLSSGA